MGKPHQSFTPEFKREAVQLATMPGNNASKIARDLGVSAQAVNRWVKEHQIASEMNRPSFPGRGKPSLSEQERHIKDLEKEVSILKQEREILKLAARFFAKESS